MIDERLYNRTANASGAQEDIRRAQEKLKDVEAQIRYSAQLADVITRLANWVGLQKGG